MNERAEALGNVLMHSSDGYRRDILYRLKEHRDRDEVPLGINRRPSGINSLERALITDSATIEMARRPKMLRAGSASWVVMKERGLEFLSNAGE